MNTEEIVDKAIAMKSKTKSVAMKCWSKIASAWRSGPKGKAIVTGSVVLALFVVDSLCDDDVVADDALFESALEEANANMVATMAGGKNMSSHEESSIFIIINIIYCSIIY